MNIWFCQLTQNMKTLMCARSDLRLIKNIFQSIFPLSLRSSFSCDLITYGSVSQRTVFSFSKNSVSSALFESSNRLFTVNNNHGYQENSKKTCTL
jgi:hypothetical protein